VVELITAISFVLFARSLGFGISNIELWFGLIFIALFIVIAVFDFKHYLILDKVTLPAAIVALIYVMTRSFYLHSFGLHSPLVQGLFGVIIISGFFGIQYLASRGRWIGLGDVKLGVFLGLVFGVGLSLELLFLSYLVGAVVGLGLVAAGKKDLSGKTTVWDFFSFLWYNCTSIWTWVIGLLP
jgi:prepilin signal peptidase PulO-like enzyme (type II secretory pathway)